jgi:hypothetical protein
LASVTDSCAGAELKFLNIVANGFVRELNFFAIIEKIQAIVQDFLCRYKCVLIALIVVGTAIHTLREQDTTLTAQSYADGFLSGPSA